MKDNTIVLPPDAEGGIKFVPPQGCEVDKVEVVDGELFIFIKKKEKQLPKTWEEFCMDFPIKKGEYYIGEHSFIEEATLSLRAAQTDKRLLPDRATAEAVLALCQLIQLRNCYNGDWMPDWSKEWFQGHRVSIIAIKGEFEVPGKIDIDTSYTAGTPHLLHFKDNKTASEFLRNFRPIIEKLKPLYGIKEGGKQ